ncbi:hypothetical protein AUK22_01810 [bacterium CG2_30_54_10]|nr:MAG: hypothetical protein AUK22_01810 [bacterium CG2_30_54_10]
MNPSRKRRKNRVGNKSAEHPGFLLAEIERYPGFFSNPKRTACGLQSLLNLTEWGCPDGVQVLARSDGGSAIAAISKATGENHRKAHQTTEQCPCGD